jgi:hypothetical protein
MLEVRTNEEPSVLKRECHHYASQTRIEADEMAPNDFFNVEKEGRNMTLQLKEVSAALRGAALLFITVVSLVGCAVTPQTRNEFKQQIMDYPTMGLHDTYTANRRFEDVVRTLDAKWQECYNISKTMTRTQGGLTTMRYRDTYHPKSQKINNSLVEMTLQETSQGITMLNKIPPGGLYVAALNLERLPANKTKLTWYSGAWGWRAIWEMNKQWSDGKDVACDAE